jgi:hypothetical protein
VTTGILRPDIQVHAVLDGTKVHAVQFEGLRLHFVGDPLGGRVQRKTMLWKVDSHGSVNATFLNIGQNLLRGTILDA